jgi:large subunit ribosomal protein L6
MSRIGKQPIIIPSFVKVAVSGDNFVEVEGPKGRLNKKINNYVSLSITGEEVVVKPINTSKNANMQSGTARALINNMVLGVSQGFEKKLQLFGIGYRVQVQGSTLNLILGFSHPINYNLPDCVTAEVPSQTEVVLKSIDKQLLGRVAADIRSYRVPEVYKGKGIRYSDEQITTKEAKKK